MAFKLGTTSRKQLTGVHPKLVAVVEKAIEITDQDFSVISGLRSAEEQNRLYRRGASKLDGFNSKSMHQRQDDGFGHAVDLVPYINGQPRWEWPAIYPICFAVKTAARELSASVRWGGFWNYISPECVYDISTPLAIERAVREYTARRVARGKSAFTDGPHYELR